MSRKEIKSVSILKEPREDINDNFTELYDAVAALQMDPPDNDPTKVPYTGATQDTDLGDYAITVDALQLSSTPTSRAGADGLIQWNSTDGTIDLGMSGGTVVQQVGQELFVKVVNKTAALIPNGSAVYFDGRLGTRPKIKLARGDSSATCDVVGVTTQDIDVNAEGFVTTFGYVRGIKTDYAGWAEGDILWLSTTTAGSLTKTEPSAPHCSPIVGSVGIVHSNLGSIFIRVQPAKVLQDLADVNGTALTTTGQIPVWNNTAGYFDFTSNIEDFVPYTGAVADVDLGAHSLITTSIEANISDITVDCGLNKTIALAQSVWEDLRFPPSRTMVGALGKPDYDYTNCGFLFPQNDTGEVIYIVAQFPHAYKLTTSIYPHIHFIQSSADVPVFKLSYRWYKNGSTPPSFTTITTNSLAFSYTSGSITQVALFPAISGVSIDTISSILDMKLYRDDNVVTGDVLVKELDIHYEIDTLGSRTILAK